MRFEAKKKALADAVSHVKTLTNALSTGQTDGEGFVFLLADAKGLKLKTVNGNQVVEAAVGEVKVEEEGRAAVVLKALDDALKIGGDLFKLIFEDGKADAQFSCGRSRGRLQVTETDVELKTTGPKATVMIPNFRSLLRTIALKAASGKAADRTLHFDADKLSVRGEATDTSRAVLSTLKLPDDSKISMTGAVNLPAKALDELARLMDGDAIVGYDETFFTVKAPGLYVCMPQTSNSPFNLQGQMDEWLASMTKVHSSINHVAAFKDALPDPTALTAAADGRLTLAFEGASAKFIGESDQGSIETDFEVVTKSKAAYRGLIMPGHIKECLAFYKESEVLHVDLYTQALRFNITESDSGLESQITVMPFVTPLQDGEGNDLKPKGAVITKTKTPDPAPKADEDDEAPAPATKAKPTKKPAPKPEPEAEVEEPETEEPKPAPKPAPKPKPAAAKPEPKKPAPAPPEPEPEAADDDADADADDDEEEFDDAGDDE